MSFRKRLSTMTMVAATVLSMPQANANQNFENGIRPISITQQANSQKDKISGQSVSNGFELLGKLKNGEVIEYQGLKFDTQKLRSAQKANKLSGFDFVIRDNETGLSFQDPKNPNHKFLILMPPDQLEGLINFVIAKDIGLPADEKPKPLNPHDWQYQSNQPQYLTETPEGRRPMTVEDMRSVYTQAVDAIFKMHEYGVIDMGDIIDKYAEKVGGMAGATLKTIYHVTPLILFQKKINGYSEQVVSEMQKAPEYEKKLRENFEKEKAQAIAKYDYEEKIRKEEEQKLALEKREKEQKRVAALIRIRGENFKPTIEDGPYDKTLSFEDGQNFISITQSKLTKKISYAQIGLFDKQGQWIENKEIQPEEWADISKLLSQKLTTKQKQQLGSDFLKSVSGKSNMVLQLACERATNTHI